MVLLDAGKHRHLLSNLCACLSCSLWISLHCNCTNCKMKVSRALKSYTLNKSNVKLNNQCHCFFCFHLCEINGVYFYVLLDFTSNDYVIFKFFSSLICCILYFIRVLIVYAICFLSDPFLKKSVCFLFWVLIHLT